MKETRREVRETRSAEWPDLVPEALVDGDAVPPSQHVGVGLI